MLQSLEKWYASPWRSVIWIPAVLAVGGLAVAFVRLPADPVSDPNAALPVRPVDPVPDLSQAAWDVFTSSGTAAAGPAGPLAARFRLAGTFFTYGSSDTDTGPSGRMAILDDVEQNTQHMVSEDQAIGDVKVERISRDRVLVSRGGQREELRLAFSDRPVEKDPPAGTEATASTDSFEAMPALETNRFGKRIGESRWVLYRDRLQQYYQELLDEPERLASIYLSLKPVREDAGEIGGYFLDEDIPDPLFAAAGFKQGDVIRSVNSIRMVSQPRGEYIFREFLNNNLNTFVFDVERNGENEKLIYLIR